MQRSLRRIKHRIKRLVTSYVSPLGWAVTGLAIASLIAFTILSWHELLTMAIVFTCMMVAAIMLSLGNTSFTATIDVSSRRVTVSDTVKVDVCVDNPGRTPTTSARGDLPIGDSHERFAIPMLAAGQSRQTTVEFTAVWKTLGRNDLGSLEVEKGADLFIIDTRGLEFTGAIHDPKNLLARAGVTGPVWMTIVNGKIVYADGHLTGVDEEKFAREGEGVCTKVLRSQFPNYWK